VFAIATWWVVSLVAKVVAFALGRRPWQGPKTPGSAEAHPSSLRSIARIGVHRAGSWDNTASSQSHIKIAVAFALGEVGSGRK
jgi:hypothetical protein